VDLAFLIASLVKIGVFFGITMGLVSLATYGERRISAIMQDRSGPNRVGVPYTKFRLAGLGQPIADGIKFLVKEDFTPGHVKKFYFILAPCLVLIPALLTLSVLPFGAHFAHEAPGWLPDWLPAWLTSAKVSTPMAIADLDVGPLFVFAIASLTVYGIVLAGWSSNSKYPFLGGIRSTSQMISYEIALGLSLIPVLIVFGTLNLNEMVEQQSRDGWLLLPVSLFGENAGLDWQRWLLWIPLMIAFVIFMVSLFAETNRTPFDLPECETELVAGYHTEYSSMKFALFFMGEYAAMIIGSGIAVTLFFGGWSLPLGLDAKLYDWFGANADWWLMNWLHSVVGAGDWAVALISMGVFLAKVVGIVLFFIVIRWTVPRFRYDQLMKLGWIWFFEIALVNILIVAALVAFVFKG